MRAIGVLVLLYVHVPFCVRKCGYCAFASQLPTIPDLDAWVDGVLAEIEHFAPKLGRRTIETLYVGGGTPSAVPVSYLTEVVNRLFKRFHFRDGFEATVEANPESFLKADVAFNLKSMGFNRLSLGVQSFRDAHLKRLERPHTARQAIRAVEIARRVGFGNVNLDLMHALPGQRLKERLGDLKTAVELGVEHVSSYSLTFEEDTPLCRAALAGEFDPVGERESAKMYILGAEYLESNGLIQYEISNFARMGMQSRHNLGYWEGTDYLGLGPSAVSTIRGVRRTNPPTVAAYAALAGRDFADPQLEILTPEIRLTELVMLRLRTTAGLRLAAYKKITGVNFLGRRPGLVAALKRNELIRVAGGRVKLTKNGFLTADSIIAELL